jgi:1,4-dihydroxy-2-naphthoate octaprenyltransferase
MRLINQKHLIYLILSSLTFFLGAGIARYLGFGISFIGLILGWFVTIAFLLSALFFDDYFMEKTTSGNRKNLIPLLQTACGLFVFCGLIIIGLLKLNLLNWSAGILLIFTTLLIIFYSMPPFGLAETGFGEILLALIISFNIPVFSFLLQSEEFHHLLIFVAIPLTMLTVAFHLAMDFSTNSNRDIRNRRTLLDRIPWKVVLTIHGTLILAAYLLYSMMTLFGVSWNVIWPIFLAFPFSFLEILWLHLIGRGLKPNWKYYNWVIPIIFGLPVYLLLVSFWTR